MDKFRSNDDRIAYLKDAFRASDFNARQAAMKLAWEWIKTGKFARKEFEQVMVAYAQAVAQ